MTTGEIAFEFLASLVMPVIFRRVKRTNSLSSKQLVHFALQGCAVRNKNIIMTYISIYVNIYKDIKSYVYMFKE